LFNGRFKVALADLRIPRQKVLVGAGLGLAAVVIAACSSSKENSAPSGEASSSGAAKPSGDVIAKTADVPVGGGVIVGEVVVTQPTTGDFKAFSAKCTHKGCTVNKIADGTIDCPCHGSKFNLDGSVEHGPATAPLEAKAIAVQGDSIVSA
jgi:Rieske Fe-S protein